MSRFRIVQIRRWASKQLRRRLPRLAARCDPGPRVRLWDTNWNLKADTDRGDQIPFDTLDWDGLASMVYEPATTIRLRGGHA